MIDFAKSMRRCLSFLVVPVLIMAVPVQAADRPVHVQRMLDQAKPGDTVRLPPGTYEGPLLIDKPIHLSGQDATIIRSAHSSPETPLLRVETDGATISGLNVSDERGGLAVRGDDNRFRDLTIHTKGIAVKLENANRNVLQGLHIIGREPDLKKRRNGIEIWNSQDNRIEDSVLDLVKDGVYLDNSENTLITHNRISDSRYAVHMMFSHRSEVTDNDLQQNVTGAMVMEDVGSRIVGNRITKQAGHAQSQGIFLYQVEGAEIVNNLIDGNRIGLHVDAASGNRIANNRVTRNFLGMRMQESAQNQIHANTWSGNAVQAQAIESRDNLVSGNYWDDHQGLDVNGDGSSDLSYQASPFYLSLTDAVSAYQFFFQSPGLAVFEDLSTSGTDQWLHDPSPLMSPPGSEQSEPSPAQGPVLMFSLLLLGAGFYPFWRNYRRSVSS